MPVRDRREIFRPFLARINPLVSAREILEKDLVVAREADPQDREEPPIHMAHSGRLNFAI
jgi:hypothetical protein